MRVFAIAALLATLTAAAAPPPYVSYSLDVEPWGFQQTNKGISPEFIQYLAHATGLHIDTQVVPYLRVLDGMRSGASALTMGIPTPERERDGIRLCTPTQLTLFLSYDADRQPAIHNLAGFAGKAIGELRGSHTLDQFDHDVPHQLVPISTMTQGFKMLAAGRLDGTLCVHPGCGIAMTQAGVIPRAYTELSLNLAEPVAVYLSRNSPLARDSDMTQRLRAACESPEGRERMQSLLSQYR